MNVLNKEVLEVFTKPISALGLQAYLTPLVS